MNPAQILLRNAIPHKCQTGFCPVTCPHGSMEIPSDDFVAACNATPRRPNGEPLAPD